MHMSPLPIGVILVFINLLRDSSSRTDFINTDDCFGLPESPVSIEGAVVTSSPSTGQSICYFQPEVVGQYFNIRLDELNLPETSGNCPTITINEFSAVRQEFLDETDPFLRATMTVPTGLQLLVEANCTNYKERVHAVSRTSSGGLKLQLLYKPGTASRAEITYKITISSFVFGPSFSCPDGTFRCWNERTMCILESLTCDGVNNCNDDSDENNYLCTGRINGIPLPLFAIIIITAFIILLLFVVLIVFTLRSWKRKKETKEQIWIDMTMRPQQPVMQPLIDKPGWAPSG